MDDAMVSDNPSWYAVRCIFEIRKGFYEERITLWRSDSFERAIELAEAEAEAYVASVEINGYVGLAQAFLVGEDQPASGDEIFSLLRESSLNPPEYVATFFDTGRERQGGVDVNADPTEP